MWIHLECNKSFSNQVLWVEGETRKHDLCCMLGDREKERSIYASDVYQTVLKHPFYIFSPISFKYFDSLKNCIGQVLFQSLYPRFFLLPSHIGATTKFSPCSTKKSPPKIEKNGRGPPGIYLTPSIANKRRKIIGKLTLLRGVGSQQMNYM